MAIEQTFAIIKPDAIQAKNSGKIINMIERCRF
jgi:nucleoside diphosphate kinase